MKKQKNIFFFLPNFSLGGAGNSVKNICKIIKSNQNRITVFSIGKNHYKRELLRSNIDVIELKVTKTLHGIFKIKKYLNEKYNNKKVIFVSNINYGNVISCIFLKSLKNLKLVLIERTPIQELKIFFNLNEYFKKKIIYYLMILFYKNADFIIGNSKKLSSDLSNHIKKKIITICPYIKIKKVKKKYNKIIKLIWIGRDSPEKSLNIFLKSLQYLKEKNLDITILVDKNLDNIKNEIPIFYQKKIKILKFFDNNKSIKQLYKNSDILISSSIYEGFPNVIAEAINHNCLIITSNSFGGRHDLIKNEKFGLIYNKYDFKELSQKILFAINNFNKCKSKIFLAKKNLIKIAHNNNDGYISFFNKNF